MQISQFQEFTSRIQLSDEERTIFRHLLLRLKETCEAKNLTYFLYSGSLLGLERVGGVLPWDDDIDVAILADDLKVLREVHSEGRDDVITKRNLNKKILKFFSATNFTIDFPRYSWHYPFIDVFPFKRDPEKKSVFIFDRNFEEDVIFPLRTATFEGIQVKIPNRVRDTIKIIYGVQSEDDLIKTCQIGRYDHRLEDAREDENGANFYVPCRDVQQIYQLRL